MGHLDVVGFLGLGVMGGGMAANIAKAGHEVVAFDPSEAARVRAAEHGITLVDSPREVAQRSTGAIVSMVRTADQTQDVLFGDTGVAAAGRDGLDLVVMSTLDPGTVAHLSATAAASGLTLFDAGVSGGGWGADAGTLTIMLSGPPAAIGRTRPLFDAMGSNVFELGEDVGSAQAAKLAVQLGFAVSMLGAFEALALASSHGVDEEQLMAILSLSVGDTWVTRNWPRVRGWWENYVPGEDLDILLKDLRAMLRDADERTVGLPVTALSFQRMRHVWSESPAPVA